MPTRNQILDALRSGLTTAPEIAKRLGAKSVDIYNTLYRMRRIGRVILGRPVESDGERNGRPPMQWSVNESWVSQRYSARARAIIAEKRTKRGPESEAKRIAAIRAHYAARGPVSKLAIPKWVLQTHRRTYREIARVLDEETAAEWARKAKAMLNGGGNGRVAETNGSPPPDDSLRTG